MMDRTQDHLWRQSADKELQTRKFLDVLLLVPIAHKRVPMNVYLHCCVAKDSTHFSRITNTLNLVIETPYLEENIGMWMHIHTCHIQKQPHHMKPKRNYSLRGLTRIPQ